MQSQGIRGVSQLLRPELALPRGQAEIFTKTEEVELITAAIMEAAHTGVPGDGVVAVLPIGSLYLIRTRCEATKENFWSGRAAERR